MTSLLLILLGVPIILSIAWLITNQGRFYVEQVTLPEDPQSQYSDTQFILKVLNGFEIHSIEFARWHGDLSNRFSFIPNAQISVEVISSNPTTSQQTLALRGVNSIGGDVVALVDYEAGEFRIIPNFNGSPRREIDFSAEKVILKNLDDDPELEVIQAIKLTAENGSASNWHKTRFDYDEFRGAYTQTSTILEQNL